MYFAHQQFTDQKLTKILLYHYLKVLELNRKLYDGRKRPKIFLKDFPRCFALKLSNMLEPALF